MTHDQTCAPVQDPEREGATPEAPGRTRGAGIPVTRRTLIVTGGAVGAAAALAACGGGGAAESSASTSSASASSAPATSAAPSSAPATSAAPTTSAPAPAGDVLAPVADIPGGGGQVFDGPKVVVTQPEAGVIKGFTAVCPHQGCLVSTVTNNEILCPCHGSLFSAEDGAVIAGPATSGLAPAAVTVDGDSVVLG
ncbi:MAG: Rieske (2Fe-2S) protein [bacterium]